MAARSPDDCNGMHPDNVPVRYRLFDMHCHLSQMANAGQVARDAANAGLAIFDCGVEPGAFAQQRERFAHIENVAVGAGLHPWWLSGGRCGERDIALLCEIAQSERFIGEIGLDFSRKHEASRELQTKTFDALCSTLAASPLSGRVLSIHAVQSAGTVLDILEAHRLIGIHVARKALGKQRTEHLCAHGETSDKASAIPAGETPAQRVVSAESHPSANACDAPNENTCAVIFHWFSGSGDELVRAREDGCFFSVNEMMLKTRRGRAYANQIPADRLLLETDAPPELGAPYTAGAQAGQLDRTLNVLAEIKGVCKCELARTIARTSAAILGMS